jgi:sugar lactone lactonase YvrE
LDAPIGIAIDGAGNVWAANAEANSVSEFSSTGTAITGTNGYGYNNNALSGVAVLAIDGSGNIWLTNPEATGDAANTLTELVGAAAPVVTPKVANLIAPYGTYAVNKP